ncbi:hypothetical protein Cwoe_1787 [Conexibacter woesei DSM 14684]|uniref:Uncharacterized protein n=1 Tax=Conexibacter woesei (strain DSM 14684 / CCUG 47730 / CIP 108061 / JCM 11494 / NBRC 100937 / ID131577) TaxID=469383 RepID=D3F238_CONWI|nr:hypothetical protein Cwoe_1787 [Conexibacter woesei DSM 14684]
MERTRGWTRAVAITTVALVISVLLLRLCLRG